LINETHDFNIKGRVSINLNIIANCKNKKISSISLKGAFFNLKSNSHKFNFLKEPFNYEFKDNNGNIFKRKIGPSNPFFTQLKKLPQFLIKVLITSEDATFFTHKGIDFESISTAFKDDLKKKILRGGSTITQQLVKNIFLNRKKNIVRKLKEALFAIELNNTISKERQLEIYFNIVEFGPGIIGIGEASEHFFGKTPEKLTLLEAVYLVSIIPAPEKYYFYFQKNEVSNNFMKRIYKTITKMYDRDFLTSQEFQKAMNQTIKFKDKINY
jgi:membrane peptidoglycan carboxypeptidase